jgi:transcription initiation factor TFIID subunit 2
MFVNSSAHDSARHWLPCLDNLWDRCPWELEIAVPRYLKQEAESADEGIERGPDDIMIEDGEIVRVVASAELEEQVWPASLLSVTHPSRSTFQVIHPEDPKKTIFYFVQSNPTSAQQMSFAAGPFHIHVIPEEDQTRRLLDSLDPTSDVQPLLLAYCLPGFELDLANSVSCMRQAMSFFEGYDGYPYSSFKMVFVEDPSSQSSTSASMTTFSQELLYPPEVLEQALITRPILTGSLAAQWSGVHMVPRSYSDIWLTLGLSLYINAQFTRHLLGNNDYRDRLRSDMDRCIALDKGEQYPLYVPGAIALPDLDALQFIALKAPLILHMLDIRMARLATSSGLARNVIPDIFRQARGGTLPDRALSTENFFRICRKVSKSLDLAAFQEQWVTGSGCPKFVIGAQYNKKGQSITVSVFQGPSQAWSTVSRVEPQSLEWKSPTKHFSVSQSTISAYESHLHVVVI